MICISITLMKGNLIIDVINVKLYNTRVLVLVQ